MRLPGEEDPKGVGLPVVYMVVGVLAFVAVILFMVVQSNSESKGGSDYLKALQEQEEEEAAAEELAAEKEEEEKPKLRAEDLDFWDMYPVEDDESTDEKTDIGQEDTKKKTSYEEKAEKERQERKQKEEQEALSDPSTDGKHTLVKNADGSEEWVLISPYLTKHTYDFTKLEEKAGIMRYMQDGKIVSYVGVDLSKQNGEVNFAGMKAAGVDYVMIRLGSRGYSTGQITLDENFNDYMKGAIDAGLSVGVYFYSQAISQEEAVQEANFVVQNLTPYQANVKYPVAFDMEFVPNDAARIDGLSRDDKTSIAVSFLEAVKAAGYVPMVYGNKEWLVKEVDLSKLQNFDVWLSQDEDMPDFPYQFTMWQYDTGAVLNGVSNANLNISFVGYSQR